VAQAEYWMGKMLYDDYKSEEALSLFKKADARFGLRYEERAYVQNGEATAYIILKQLEQAENCLKKSLNFAEQGLCDKVKIKILNNYAVLCRLEGKHAEAIAYLKKIEGVDYLNDSEKTMLFLNLGKSFLAQNEYDSAAICFHRMEELLPTEHVKNETKASAYRTLSHLAEIRGDTVLALRYLKNRDEQIALILAKIEKNTAYRIQRQYDYESLQNEMNRKLIQRYFTILIISILLLITTIIALVLQYRHKQLLKSEAEMKQQMDTLKQDLLQTVKISVLDHEISSRLRLILKVHDKTLQGNDPKKEWQSLVWQIMNGKEDPFEAARSVLETAYPKLYSTIKESYPNLTETETKIYLLSCSDLSNAEIAELLGLSTNTINQNRSNLRKKLNLKSDDMKEQLRMTLSK
jgi:DNA-binding CsgD family transcriptional regulator